MTEPQRIQRRRTPGWRMPDNAVYVGRPTVWGNVWKVGSTGWTCGPGGVWDKTQHEPLTAEQAVESFRHATEYLMQADPEYAAMLREALAGRDLACWCPVGAPCHADVLLKVANS